MSASPDIIPDSVVVDSSASAGGEEQDFSSITEGVRSMFGNSALPIIPHIGEFLQMHSRHSLCSLTGPCGSGKSVCIPNAVMMTGERVWCALPTSHMVRSMYKYLQSLAPNTTIGSMFGGVHRNVDSSNLVIGTAGAMYRRLLSNLESCKIDTLMIDEAHTDSVDYAMLRQTLVAWCMRNNRALPFKVIICSATTDRYQLAKDWLVLGEMEHMTIHVPFHEVVVKYHDTEEFDLTADNTDQLAATVSKIQEMDAQMPPGNFLVFLSGVAAINYVYDALMALDEKEFGHLQLYIVHGNASDEDLAAALDIKMPEKGSKTRDVVLATEMLESSITIRGLRVVFDTGMHKYVVVNDDGTETLVTGQTTKYSQKQRAGRCGREMSGFVFPIYSERQALRGGDADMELHGTGSFDRESLFGPVLTVCHYGHDPRAFFGEHYTVRVRLILAELVNLELVTFEKKGADQQQRQILLKKEAITISKMPVEFHVGLAYSRLHAAAQSAASVVANTDFQIMALILCLTQSLGTQSLYFIPKKMDRSQSQNEFRAFINEYKREHYKRFEAASDLASAAFIMLSHAREIGAANVSCGHGGGGGGGGARKFALRKTTTWASNNGINNKQLRNAWALYHRMAKSFRDGAAKGWNASSTSSSEPLGWIAAAFPPQCRDAEVLAAIDSAITNSMDVLCAVFPKNVYVRVGARTEEEDNENDDDDDEGVLPPPSAELWVSVEKREMRAGTQTYKIGRDSMFSKPPPPSMQRPKNVTRLFALSSNNVQKGMNTLRFIDRIVDISPPPRSSSKKKKKRVV